jgi:hypothetical protein
VNIILNDPYLAKEAYGGHGAQAFKPAKLLIANHGGIGQFVTKLPLW